MLSKCEERNMWYRSRVVAKRSVGTTGKQKAGREEEEMTRAKRGKVEAFG
jgi:hypothetical protein